jgi:site-specific DNA recombinase
VNVNTINRQFRSSNKSLAVAYLRASKEEQLLSEPAQRAVIESWATKDGVTIVAWCVDQGVCSTTPIEERPALCAALVALRENAAGLLVVAKRDRIARDPIITAMIERTAASRGARVVSASGEGNGDTPGDVFMRRVIDGAAEYEHALIRARTKAALATKKANGLRVGGIPFGFELAPDGKTLIPCASERKTIERVKALRSRGIPIRKLVVECAKRGIVSRAGRPFHKSAIERLLRWAA